MEAYQEKFQHMVDKIDANAKWSSIAQAEKQNSNIVVGNVRQYMENQWKGEEAEKRKLIDMNFERLHRGDSRKKFLRDMKE